MLLSAQQDGSDQVSEEFTQEKKPKDFFKNLLKAQSQDNDEGLGVMEADTLGLPEVVGSLRDEMKSCVAARALRGQVARILAISLEEMASAAITLAAGLEQRLGQEGYKDKGYVCSVNGRNILVIHSLLFCQSQKIETPKSFE